MFLNSSFLQGIYGSSRSVGSSLWSIPCSFSQRQLTNFTIETIPASRIIINWGDFTASTVINSGQTATHTFLSCDPLVFLPVPNIMPTLNYSVWGVGLNSAGKLGLGDNTNRSTFTQLTGNWAFISSSASHSLALSGSKMFAAGQNISGELGLGDNTNRNTFTQLTGNWSRAETSSLQFSIALSGNKIFSTGSNHLGQLGLGDNTNRNTFTQVTGNWDSLACGYTHTFVFSGNRLFATGWNNLGQLGLGDNVDRNTFTQVAGNWDVVVGGGAFSFALSGSRWFATGLNSSGELGLGDTTDRNTFTQVTGDWDTIACGNKFACALSGTKLFVTGENVYGQLGLGDNTNRNTFTQVPGNWSSVACGSQSIYALSGSKLYVAGQNNVGQLGLGDTTDRNTLTQVTGDWNLHFNKNGFAFALSGIPFDPDVQLYLNRVGDSLTVSSVWNLYYFITKLKEANIWSSIVDGWLLSAPYNRGRGRTVVALKNKLNNGLITDGGNNISPTWEQKGIRFYNDGSTSDLGPRITIPTWTGTSLTGPVSIVSVFSPFERKSTGSCVFGKTSFGQTANESHFGINFGFQPSTIDTYHGLNGVTNTTFPGVSTTENLYWMTGLGTDGAVVDSFLNGYTASSSQTFTTGTLVSAIGFSYDVTGRVADREFIGIINSGFVFSTKVDMNTFWEIFRGTIGRDLSFVQYPIYY